MKYIVSFPEFDKWDKKTGEYSVRVEFEVDDQIPIGAFVFFELTKEQIKQLNNNISNIDGEINSVIYDGITNTFEMTCIKC
jgi:hypothetical protein